MFVLTLLLLATPVLADTKSDLPRYEAVVDYKATENGPQKREVFGDFRSLSECRQHGDGRVQALIQKNRLYGGRAFCFLYWSPKEKPVLLD